MNQALLLFNESIIRLGGIAGGKTTMPANYLCERMNV